MISIYSSRLSYRPWVRTIVILFVESEFSNNVNIFVRCNMISFYSFLHNRKSFPPRTPREGTLDAMSLHYAETSLPDLLSSLSLHYSEQTSAMQTVPPLCIERASTIYGTAFFKYWLICVIKMLPFFNWHSGMRVSQRWEVFINYHISS